MDVSELLQISHFNLLASETFRRFLFLSLPSLFVEKVEISFFQPNLKERERERVKDIKIDPCRFIASEMTVSRLRPLLNKWAGEERSAN